MSIEAMEIEMHSALAEHRDEVSELSRRIEALVVRHSPQIGFTALAMALHVLSQSVDEPEQALIAIHKFAIGARRIQ